MSKTPLQDMVKARSIGNKPLIVPNKLEITDTTKPTGVSKREYIL